MFTHYSSAVPNTLPDGVQVFWVRPSAPGLQRPSPVLLVDSLVPLLASFRKFIIKY